MLVRDNCTQCSNPIERSPRHPDPITCRGLLCRRCFGEVHWAWIMWKCGPVPHGHNCVEECCAENKGTPLNAKTAARPRAIAAVVLASMLRDPIVGKVMAAHRRSIVVSIWTLADVRSALGMDQ